MTTAGDLFLGCMQTLTIKCLELPSHDHVSILIVFLSRIKSSSLMLGLILGFQWNVTSTSVKWFSSSCFAIRWWSITDWLAGHTDTSSYDVGTPVISVMSLLNWDSPPTDMSTATAWSSFISMGEQRSNTKTVSTNIFFICPICVFVLSLYQEDVISADNLCKY